MLLKSNYLYAYKGELLEYSHETINGNVFQHKARERVELKNSQIVFLNEVTNETHPTMIQILEKNNDMVHIHMSYVILTDATLLADKLIKNKVVDIDEIRNNFKTHTALLIGQKDVNYSEQSIIDLAK